MKRISLLAFIGACILALLLVGPGYSHAFKKPTQDNEMIKQDENAESLFKAPEMLKAKPGLTTIVRRNLNEAVTGDAVLGAKSFVENLLRPRQGMGEQNSLSEFLEGRHSLKTTGFTFEEERVQVDKLGYTHVRLAQYYQGLPVVGGELVVHINDRDVIYQLNGKYLQAVKTSIQPSITADEALTIGLEEQKGKPDLQITRMPALVIYGDYLAYHYVISHKGPDVGQWWYYVDAHTGKLIYRYNNIQYAAPNEGSGSHAPVSGYRLTGEDGSLVSMTGFWESSGSGNYFLYNFNDLWGIYDEDVYDWEQNATSNWGTSDRAAVSSGKNFELTQNFVTTVLGRDSFNDAGAFARANVHTGTNYVNAYWDGTDFHFGDGDGVTADPLTVLDVSAHEYGHAVTQYTSELEYSYESGALNEAYSDIMGSTVEFYHQPDGRGSYPSSTPGYSDWLMGEDCWLAEEALRDLRDPHRYELPSYYHGTYWYYGSGDNGGVHTNCMVGEFAFYLLAEGGSGVNDGHPYGPITGIGIANAAEVAIRANMVYHTMYDEYADAREAWISAATDLGQPVSTVEQVWDAVGVLAAGELIESFASPSGASMGLDYDDQRGGVWVVGEDGYIYLVGEPSPHTVMKTINLVGIAVAPDGNTNGVCVLSNGNLLLTDYNGDLTNIDDYLFEINPDTETLINYWPVDGAWNTSTDGTYIDSVVGVEIGPSGHAFVTSAWDNYVYEIALVPGLPGTWSTVTVHTATSVSTALGIDRIECPSFSGWLVGDWDSTTVAFLDEAFSTTASFPASHDGNSFNSGVTAIPVLSAEPMNIWTTDFGTDYIGVFNSGVVCGGAEAGVVIQHWTPASNTEPWGIACTSSNIWVGDGWGVNATYEYQTNGTATGRSWPYSWMPSNGPADSAFNPNTGMVWVMDVGSDNCLHEMNPASGFTGNTICGPWTISQRGLAYDPDTNTYFVGGWNEGIIYHINAAGALLDSAYVGLGIAGLAYNPDTQHLFVIENWAPNNIIYVLDASAGYSLVRQFTIAPFSDYSGAGLAIDSQRNLWAVQQVTNEVYEFTSGEEIEIPYTPGDYDGDGDTDVAMNHLPSNQFFVRGIGNLGKYGWGGTDSMPLVWDYDGDGVTEVSFYHIPSNQWFVKGVGNLGKYGWGGEVCVPVPGDYDGNGVMERAFYHSPTNRWFVEGASPVTFGWGGANCIPVPGDYNGDGTTDMMIYHVPTNQWLLYGVGNLGKFGWGGADCIPVPGDYDGDGVTDIAVLHVPSNQWFLKGVGNLGKYGWGGFDSFPIHGDYNGDRSVERGFYRHATNRWFLEGQADFSWGWGGADCMPITSSYCVYNWFMFMLGIFN